MRSNSTLHIDQPQLPDIQFLPIDIKKLIQKDQIDSFVQSQSTIHGHEPLLGSEEDKSSSPEVYDF